MNYEYLVWAALGAAVLLVLVRSFRRPPAPPPSPEEKAPELVDGSPVFTGIHKGVKYWVYLEDGQARLEIEAGHELAKPYVADRRTGPARLAGDPRDVEALELFKLRAVYVEAAGKLVMAQFPDRELNENAATTAAPQPKAGAAARVAELLTAIRDKSAVNP